LRTCGKRTDAQQTVRLPIIESLHDHGIGVNTVSSDKLHYSPLATAARRGLVDVVNWLLQEGAHPEIADSRGKTPLNYVDESLRAKSTLLANQDIKRLSAIRASLSSPPTNDKTYQL
jgi:ankyrin repeat protein